MGRPPFSSSARMVAMRSAWSLGAVAEVQPEDIGAGAEQPRIRSGVEEAGPSVATILVRRRRRGTDMGGTAPGWEGQPRRVPG